MLERNHKDEKWMGQGVITTQSHAFECKRVQDNTYT